MIEFGLGIAIAIAIFAFGIGFAMREPKIFGLCTKLEPNLNRMSRT